MIDTLTDILVVGAWVASAIFVGRYLLTRWYKTPMGFHLMSFMAAVFVVLSLAASYVIWPDWGGDGAREIVRLTSYSLINIVLWWRVIILFVNQRRARR